MNIEKTSWSSNGNRLSISVPFTKVNKENRTVSGFATLNNVDQTGDVVTAEASLKALKTLEATFVKCISQLQSEKFCHLDQKLFLIQCQNLFTMEFG